jgi:DNA-binding response OmpR family regulator
MPHSILVVDDNDAVRRVVCEMLRFEGYAVQAASSGQEAVQSTERSMPDAIVLDMMMPDMPGLDTIRALRKNGARAKVIAVSGLPDYLTVAQSAGADDVLMKPLNPDELVATIRRLLNGDTAA